MLFASAAVASRPNGVVCLHREESTPEDKASGVGLRNDRWTRSGFTLVEMLVVMGIVGLLAVAILPAASTILRGSQLTQATQLVTGQLGYARQVAISKNHGVEVRFYRYGVASLGEQPTTPSSGKFRAMQLFEITDAGTVPLGKMRRWPETIIIDPGTTDPATTYCSVIGLATASAASSVWPLLTTGTQSVTLPGVSAYDSVSFRFLPDGSVNFSSPAGPWFLTLRNQADSARPPVNFITVQIDAFNGSLRTFRP